MLKGRGGRRKMEDKKEKNKGNKQELAKYGRYESSYSHVC